MPMVIKVDLNDSAAGTIAVKTVEQLDTTGRATPTAYATGRCDFKADPPPTGCRYWIMLADNKRANASRVRKRAGRQGRSIRRSHFGVKQTLSRT